MRGVALREYEGPKNQLIVNMQQHRGVEVGRFRAFGFVTFPLRGTQRNDYLPGLQVIGLSARLPLHLVMADSVLIEGIFYGGQDFESAFRDRT